MPNNISRKNEILEKVSLRDYVTMRIGGTAKYFVEINHEKDILSFYEFAKQEGFRIFPLGGGSNTVFSDKCHDLLIFLMRNKGILKSYENSEIVNVDVQAGEDWDHLVAWSVENNYAGLECLSGIPGTVGASPIQNIGAYGSEVKNVLTKVRALDLRSGGIVEIPNDMCKFSYRNSLFKENPGRFVIISVSFSLSKTSDKVSIPQYKDVQLYFLNKGLKMATLSEIRESIIEIRNQKIPDPLTIPNSGSFFKNPIVNNSLATKIGLRYSEIPYYKIDEENAKIYAGWLIEKSGLKGFDFGKIKVDDKNALIITNPSGQASFDDLIKVIDEITNAVATKFDIKLEIEPNIIK